MIILGMGSNIGDRLQHLRRALTALSQLPDTEITRVSPVYLSAAQLPEQAPPDWNQSFLNAAVACNTRLTPDALLSAIKKIESVLGRAQVYDHWSPRVIDIDILAWDDQIIQNSSLTIPHPHLGERPFALWPLADIAPLWMHPQKHLSAEQLCSEWPSRFDGQAPFHTVQIHQRMDTPALVGIINITPDSFSDGGNFVNPEQALHQAVHLVAAGAEILDIGAESTRPQSKRLSPDEEWRRLEPALTEILAARQHFLVPVNISIDTMNAETARKAIALGVDWVNDQTGFLHPEMIAAVRDAEVDCVMMHHLIMPPQRDIVIPRDQDPISFLLQWGETELKRLAQQGIRRERVIVDPGIGFGKTPGQTLQILQQAHRLRELGTRTLIGHSRKSFQAIFTPHAAADRDIETLAITLHLAGQSVDYLRLHNVEITARALKVAAALNASPPPPYKTNQK